MSQFQGKWRVQSEESLDEIFEAFDVDGELRSKVKTGLIKPTQEITVNGEEFTITTSLGHINTQVSFKLGIEFPSSSMDGQKIMVKCKLEDGKLIEEQNYGNKQALITREIADNSLITTIDGNGKQARVVYTKI